MDQSGMKWARDWLPTCAKAARELTRQALPERRQATITLLPPSAPRLARTCLAGPDEEDGKSILYTKRPVAFDSRPVR